jgi:hypothetical protein
MSDLRIRKAPFLVKFINPTNMSKKLHLISQKIQAIRYGLLRFQEDGNQQTMQVSTSMDDGLHLSCIIREGDEMPLLNRRVSLIQKHKDDYLYISGEIDDEVKLNCKIVSFRIAKACWFTRKRKGNTVWLQEKYIYQQPEAMIDIAS